VVGEPLENGKELEGREMRKSFLILTAHRDVLGRAGCVERRSSGSGKGSWKRADDQSTGSESGVSSALGSPFGDVVTRHLPISCNHGSLVSCYVSMGRAKWPSLPV
jgi:hypothetical protein